MLDIFNTDAFSLTTLTDSILKSKFRPTRIADMGLFDERGITRTSIVIEEKDGRLSLIQTSPRGGVPSNIGAEKRTARSFTVPHLARETVVLADELQNVRSFGSEDSTDAVATIINERLTDLRGDHEVTLEKLRAGAIQGLIKDADGTTIYNLFTEFGVSQQTATVSPNASSDEGDALRGEIVAIQRLIEAEMEAEPISDYHAFCGSTFFDSLRADLGIVQTLRQSDPNSLLEGRGRRFRFGGVLWEEYRHMTSGTAFFAASEAYVFPVGSRIFKTYFGPADFVETVNTVGLPIYAKQVVDAELQRFVKIHTQSNPLSLCLVPRAVVKVTIAT